MQDRGVSNTDYVYTLIQSLSSALLNHLLESHFFYTFTINTYIRLDISVHTLTSTPWVPAHHLILRKTLTHPALVNDILRTVNTNKPLKSDIKNVIKTVKMTECNTNATNKSEIDNSTNANTSPMKTRKREKDLKDKEDQLFKESHYRIDWEDGSYATIDYYNGSLTRWIDSNGDSLLSAPLEMCLWRAPTDNDRGGGPFSYYERWKTAGKNSSLYIQIYLSINILYANKC